MILLSNFFNLLRHKEDHHCAADDKHRHNSQRTVIGDASQLGRQTKEGRANHRRKLAEYIKETKVLAGVFRGDNLAVEGSGERLNAALRSAYEHGQHQG